MWTEGLLLPSSGLSAWICFLMKTISWGDYDSKEEAFKIADERNMKRRGTMDDVCYVYDERGTYIRGNEAVGQKISP